MPVIESRLNLIIILVYVTVVLSVLVFVEEKMLLNFHKNNNVLNVQQSQEVQQILGADCLKHIHNLNNSANANLNDLGSYGLLPNPNTSRYVLWQATLQCLTNYPMYDSSRTDLLFNVSLK